MTVGCEPELDIDNNENQEKCYNNNHTNDKHKTLTTHSSEVDTTKHLKISDKNNTPAIGPHHKMGRRKQNCPQKTGIGSVDGKS